MLLCSQEQYEDAVDSLEKALEIDPQSAIVWHNKGVALKHLGRDTEARLAFACAGRLGTSLKRAEFCIDRRLLEMR